jgi:ABC-2 type transport system permease protein
VSASLLWANLRFHRLTALLWVVGAAGLGFLIAALYRSIGNVDLSGYIEALPPALVAAVGLDPDNPLGPGGRFRVEDWLSTEYLSWWLIIGAVYGVVYGAGSVAREAEAGTLDLILSHPLPRPNLVVSKSLVFLASMALISVATGISIVLGLATAGAGVSTGNLALTLLQGWLVILAIGGLAVAFSCVFLSTGKAAAVAGLLTVVFYATDIVSRTVEGADWLGNLSLFHFYRPEQVLSSGDLSWTGVVVCAAVAAGAVAVGAAVFERRDILV